MELARGAIDFAFVESSMKEGLRQTFDARAQSMDSLNGFDTSS